MRRTIIITESQERFLERLMKEDFKSIGDEPSSMPEYISSAENGVAGSVGKKLSNLPTSDIVADEMSTPDWTRFGKYLTGY